MRLGKVCLLSMFFLAKETFADDSPSKIIEESTTSGQASTPRTDVAINDDVSSTAAPFTPTPTVCDSDQFKCERGSVRNSDISCIPNSYVCDGEFSCEDKSDEKGCEKVSCSYGKFSCPEKGGNHTICIPESWKCDEEVDCANGQDEEGCDDVCTSDEFKCGKRWDIKRRISLCIPKEQACDGFEHCADNSDEINCQNVTCKRDDFGCTKRGDNYTVCFSSLRKCDRKKDCADGSDEKNCPEITGEYCSIYDFHCGDSKCIPSDFKCDGQVDCSNGSDEANCEKKTIGEERKGCANDKFDCGNGKCISDWLVCDGKDDCNDGAEDEMDCRDHPQESCDNREFQCEKTRNCIALERKCDGKNDCNDGSDEDWCVEREILCNKEMEFLCTRGARVCINKLWKCDGERDCDDGSDEAECPPRNVTSWCGEEGCRGADPIVLITTFSGIRQFNLMTKTDAPLIANQDHANAVDVHLEKQLLVWSDMRSEKINVCKVGKDDKHLAATECSEHEAALVKNENIYRQFPDGLAVDWIHDLLFWTGGSYKTVSVMDLNTRKSRVIFDDDMEHMDPRAIVVDPKKGLLFWSEWSYASGRIKRAGMNGEDRRVIIQGNNVVWPNGLALDPQEERLYYVDAKVKAIFSSDYNGNNIKVILNSTDLLREPYSLAIFGDRLFYPDTKHRGVISVNKFNGSDPILLKSSAKPPFAVKIYHNATQPTYPNKCANHDCGKDEICLPRASDQTEGKYKNVQKPYSCLSAIVETTTVKPATSTTPTATVTLQPEGLHQEEQEQSRLHDIPTEFIVASLLVSIIIIVCCILMYRHATFKGERSTDGRKNKDAECTLLDGKYNL